MRKTRMRWQISLAAAVWITLWLYYDRNGDAMFSICAAAFHECGHLLALLAVRDVPRKICFGVFGARIERASPARLSYAQEFAVSAAGPGANLLLAAGLLPLCSRAPRLRRSVRINILLALLNLLPIRPLDGGGMLYAALCRRLEPARADAWCRKIAACGTVPLAAIGIWNYLHGRRDYSLLSVFVYVLSLLLPATSM